MGYPVCLYLLSLLKTKRTAKDYSRTLPSVSVVIAARNEADTIRLRLDDLLQQQYPLDKLEIVVISDGSTDSTTLKIQEFITEQSANIRSVLYLQLPVARGKPAALNIGVGAATGEIIVFTDCRQSFDERAICELVANFADEDIGCVSGELIFRENCNSRIAAEMGAYWQYEKMVRRLESITGSVVGATGAIYAIRRELYVPIPDETLLDDVFCPLQCYLQGKRITFDSDARAYDVVSKDVKAEWQRKVRTLTGNWQLFSLIEGLLVPWKSRLWWRFFSHKVARLIVPYFLLLALFSSAVATGWFFNGVFWLQVALYVTCCMAALMKPVRDVKFIKIIYFFSVMNVAATLGLIRWLKGNYVANWK